jgi:hypothetical protein
MAAVDFTDRKTLLAYAPARRRRRVRRPAGGHLDNARRRGRGRRPALLVVLLCLAGCGLLVTVCLAAAAGPVSSRPAAARNTGVEDGYGLALQNLSDERDRLASAYRRANGLAARRRVLGEASAVLSSGIETQIVPRWYGTPYGYNGATETPGVGRIACGFFVVTVLRDAGLQVERVNLSQQPSEQIIRSLVEEKNILRYSGLPGREFLNRLKRLPDGLYMLGLDGHVGFLSLSPQGEFFIHSTLLPPYSVVREPAASSRAVMTSAYRVLGGLSADERLLEKWLGGEKITTLK